MKNSFVALSLLTMSQVASAHTSSASFAIHLVEHAITPAFAVLAIAALLVVTQKNRF